MKLQEGDKVRFLNESIEGTVSRLLSNNRVEVSTADGFSIDAFENQLVKVEFEIGLARTMAPPSKETAPQAEAEEKKIAVSPAKKAPPVSILSSLDTDETIYAAVVLADELSPLTTDIELYLVNNSSWSSVYTWNKKSNDSLELVTADLQAARSEKLIGRFSQDELHAGDGFLIRMIFYKQASYLPGPPFDKTLHIDSGQFLDSNYWEKAGGSGNRILLMPLKQFNAAKELQIDKLLHKFSVPDELAAKKDWSKPKTDRLKASPKYVILSKEKVVDLHIEELLKDFGGMNNAQIISYQINYFLNEMDKAIVNRMHKITFIHGVGQGVLKSAIREELKKFDHITYSEGPPEKFGYGATEVIFD